MLGTSLTSIYRQMLAFQWWSVCPSGIFHPEPVSALYTLLEVKSAPLFTAFYEMDPQERLPLQRNPIERVTEFKMKATVQPWQAATSTAFLGKKRGASKKVATINVHELWKKGEPVSNHSRLSHKVVDLHLYNCVASG